MKVDLRNQLCHCVHVSVTSTVWTCARSVLMTMSLACGVCFLPMPRTPWKSWNWQSSAPLKLSWVSSKKGYGRSLSCFMQVCVKRIKSECSVCVCLCVCVSVSVCLCLNVCVCVSVSVFVVCTYTCICSLMSAVNFTLRHHHHLLVKNTPNRRLFTPCPGDVSQAVQHLAERLQQRQPASLPTTRAALGGTGPAVSNTGKLWSATPWCFLSLFLSFKRTMTALPESCSCWNSRCLPCSLLFSSWRE